MYDSYTSTVGQYRTYRSVRLRGPVAKFQTGPALLGERGRQRGSGCIQEVEAEEDQDCGGRRRRPILYSKNGSEGDTRPDSGL